MSKGCVVGGGGGVGVGVVWLVMATITRGKVQHVIGYAGRVQCVINCERHDFLHHV